MDYLTTIIIGNGFDLNLNINLSFKEYSEKSHYSAPFCSEGWSWFEEHLLDRILKWEGAGCSDEEAAAINSEWQLFMSKFSYFFSQKVTELKEINKESFAYVFLKHLSSQSCVYTFNYTNPYEYDDDIELQNRQNFIHVHGRYFKDEFSNERMVISQSHNMIVGVNYSGIPQAAIDNKNLRPLIKKLHSRYEETSIKFSLQNTINVIFFGFAMGITDRDYFEDFFKSVNNHTSKCKNIYYITRTERDFKNFNDNIRALGYNPELANVNIIPMYNTMESIINDDNFRHVLRII